MARISICLTSVVFFLSLTSCTTLSLLAPPPSATPSGPRTIILDGEAVSEKDVGGFTSWYCKDFVENDRVLAEVGFFGKPTLAGQGFILYDGGYAGERTYYRRTGLEQRWDWGPNGSDYALVIQSDGTGLLYDFSSVSVGESTKACEVYKCYRR